MRTILLTIILVISNIVSAQKDTSKSNLTFTGYVEFYYCYDFSNPQDHVRPFFIYNYNRHNELNLNLGFLKANYSSDNIRSNFALMAGTYAQYSLSGEQGLLRNVYEANTGMKISKKNNIWIDAGIMPSHIGFESAIGKDNYNLTRSIVADNTPYYECGAKLGYTSKNEKLYLAAMYLNGWQRIQRIPGNQTPAFGTQFTYKTDSTITLNWSTFVGNEQPDSLAKWRYYNNFYLQFQVTEKFGIIAGFDIGIQQKNYASSDYNMCYSPIVNIQYKITHKINIAARGEYFSDINGILIPTATPNGFQTSGYSLNFDYKIRDNAVWRIEGRTLNSKDKIFSKDNDAMNTNTIITTALAISF
jgi:hypothetical protein